MASITKRGNSYRIMASAGRKVDGKQVRPTITWTPEPGMTEKQIEKELERVRIDFERQVESGQLISGKIRFAEYAETWMNRGKEGGEKPLAPKTYLRYSQLLDRINKGIGHIKMESLQPHHIRTFLDNLREEGIKDCVTYQALDKLSEALDARKQSYTAFAKACGVSESTFRIARRGGNISRESAEKICKALDHKIKELFKASGENQKLADRTVLHHYRLISAILNSAVVDDNILQANPAKRVRAPHCDQSEVVSLNEKEAEHLLELAESQPTEYKTAVRLLLLTGMRRGEALGLKWKDVDFDNNLLSVRQASQYTPDKGTFLKLPKTASSIRTIKAPAVCIATLKEYKKWQNERRLALGDLWEDEDFIFTTWNGKPIHPDTLSGWFGDFIKNSDLPKIHLHTLRHTNATLLIASGTNVRTVSKRLGHAQTSTTMNIYSHAIESADAKAAETLENILAPVKLEGK